jgi:hypothetical protein
VVELNRQPQSNDKYIAKDYSRNILPARCGLHVGHSLNPDRQAWNATMDWPRAGRKSGNATGLSMMSMHDEVHIVHKKLNSYTLLDPNLN